MRAIIFLIILLFNKTKDNKSFPINVEQLKNDLANATTVTVVRRECFYGKHFVGSNLFDGNRKICFSTDDVNLLIARRDFESMIPRDLPQDLLDDKSVTNIMRYFYYGLWLLRRLEDGNMKRIIEKAFYDTLGGFLGYYLIPVCKYSYYASKVELKTVRNVMALYQKCRYFLNTNGNGWKPPMHDPATELSGVRVDPLNINPPPSTLGTDENGEELCREDEEQKFCEELDLSTASSGMEIVDDNLIVSMPKIEIEDDNGYLSNIWLPFSRKRTFNLRSCKSAFIFVKFYRSVSSCYKEKCMPQKSFDQKFRQWIIENIRVHLSDDLFYPGLGGILNVYESLRKYEKNTNVVENTEGKDCEDSLMSKKNNEEAMVMVEENSCALAEEILPTNSKLKKRQISNEDEVNFLDKTFSNDMDIDATDESVDEWIKKFDESMLQDFQRKKVKKTKCKQKCKEMKKKLRPCSSTPTPQQPSLPPPPPLPSESTTECKTITSTTTDKPNDENTTTTMTSRECFTAIRVIPNPEETTTSQPTKTEKPPTKEKSKEKTLLRCIFISIAIVLFLLLLFALIIFFLKDDKEGWERFKQKLKELMEKLKSKKSEAQTAEAAKSVTSVKSVPSKGAVASDSKTKGKGKEADKKATPTKADKKAAKAEKKAEKTDKKDAKKAEKDAKKAEKDVKKDAKKAEKDAKKDAKKAEKDAKKDAKKDNKKGVKSESESSISPRRRGGGKPPKPPILGIRSNPTRSRQRRRGRTRSRSRSRSTG